MKKFTKIMLTAVGALVLSGTSVANYLLAQTKEKSSNLVWDNIGGEGEYGLFTGTCAQVSYDWCSVVCPRCHAVSYAAARGAGNITGGYCSECFYIP